MLNPTNTETGVKRAFRYSLLFFELLNSSFAIAQNDSVSVDKLRTESGVDPTRVNSRVGYSILYVDKSNNSSSIGNKINLTLGINRWSFAIKPEVVSLHNGVPGTGFRTELADLKFSILNAFYVKGKNSIAGSVEFNLPFGKNEFGSQYFSATPAITYAYSLSTSLFFAVQPQYTFAIAKDQLYPDLNVLTIRTFIAKFTRTGLFFVFEPRAIYNFQSKQFDLILSPIIGKSMGAGFNLIGLFELPTDQSSINSRGILFQIGFNKNF